MATSSSKKSRAESDRLSNLPDHLLPEIHSLIGWKDISRLSCVSRRWRNLVLHTPYLIVDNILTLALPYNDDNDRRGFINFLDKFMALRHAKGVVTRVFWLRWSFIGGCVEEGFHISRCLYHALASGLQELEIEGECTHVLNLFYHCGYMLIHHQSVAMVEFPCNQSVFSTIQVLVLRFVQIHPAQQDFGQWITSCCTSIKKLQLSHVFGPNIISISSSSLESFVIQNIEPNPLRHLQISAEKLKVCEIIWSFGFHVGTSLGVYAPILEEFKWNGELVHHYHFSWRSERLKIAIVHLMLATSHALQPPTPDNVLKVLRSVAGAKYLMLSGMYIRELYNRGCLPFFLPLTLKSLESLDLNVTMNDESIPAIASLLWALPNLKMLCMEDPQHTVVESLALKELTFNMDYWKSQNLLFVQVLKEACIRIARGDNEFELIKYLLKHGKMLGKMFIIYEPPLSEVVRKEIMGWKNASTQLFFIVCPGADCLFSE